MTLDGSGIVLASNSASRKAMLEAAGIAFTARGADIDERALENEMDGAEPAEIAQALAAAKAAAVSSALPDDLVLGSDSLVEVGGRRFDKPASRADAADHLRAFSGKVMTLHRRRHRRNTSNSYCCFVRDPALAIVTAEVFSL